MSNEPQEGHNRYFLPEDEIWRIRWFLIRLNAIALLLSIPASVIIAILTHNPLPGLIPAPLTAPLILIIRWAFSKPPQEKQDHKEDSKTKRLRTKGTAQSDVLSIQ
jgi:hypothetical protein